MSDKRESTGSTVTASEPSSIGRQASAKEQAWEENTLRQTLEKSPERQKQFTTISGHSIRRLYTPADLPESRHVDTPLPPPFSFHEDKFP